MKSAHPPFKSPAVIFGNAIGDHLLCLPALRALDTLFRPQLSLICMPGSRRNFFRDIPARFVCEMEMRLRGRGRVFDSSRVAEKIGKCDLLLSLNPWHSRSMDRLLKLLSPTLSVGFSPTFDVALPKDNGNHVIDRAFGVPANFDAALRVDDFAYPPMLPSRCRPRVRQFLRRVARGKRVLAIHNETKAEKMWPPGRMVRLIESFLERHLDFVVFMLDFERTAAVAVKFKERVIHSKGLPLHYAFSVIGESDLFLGADSCMLHAADLYWTPDLGLFGRAKIRGARTKYKHEQWGFRFSPHRHVWDPRGISYIREGVVLDAVECVLRQVP